MFFILVLTVEMVLYLPDEDSHESRAMVRSFVLPLVLILVGVARPSWIALPYFIYSCGGLFHWAMTSNFVGLFWYTFIHQPREVDILTAWGDTNKGIES